jgi:hypothetical protein
MAKVGEELVGLIKALIGLVIVLIIAVWVITLLFNLIELPLAGGLSGIGVFLILVLVYLLL